MTNPRGDRIGCAVTTAEGIYGYTRAYGQDDSVVPPIPGMRAGEAIRFSVNGVAARTDPPTVTWRDDKAVHAVNLRTAPSGPVYLPMLLKLG